MRSTHLAYFAGVSSVVVALGVGMAGGVSLMRSANDKAVGAQKLSKLEERKAENLRTEAETVTAPRVVAVAVPVAPQENVERRSTPQKNIAPDNLMTLTAQAPINVAPPKKPLEADRKLY